MNTHVFTKYWNERNKSRFIFFGFGFWHHNISQIDLIEYKIFAGIPKPFVT